MKSILISAACFIAGCAVALVADDPKPEALRPLSKMEKSARLDEAWGGITSRDAEDDDGHHIWVYFDAHNRRFINIIHAPNCPKCKPKFD